VAEVDHHEKWQRARLTVACVAREHGEAERLLEEAVRYLSTQARPPALHYEHGAIGFNYRMSNLLAALGRAQLAGLDAKVARRRAIKAQYRASLADIAGLGFMHRVVCAFKRDTQ